MGSFWPLPRHAGHVGVAAPPLDSSMVHHYPWVVALFNLMGVLPLIYCCILFAVGRGRLYAAPSASARPDGSSSGDPAEQQSRNQHVGVEHCVDLLQRLIGKSAKGPGHGIGQVRFANPHRLQPYLHLVGTADADGG